MVMWLVDEREVLREGPMKGKRNEPRTEPSKRAARPREADRADVVELESRDSFPASDPPSWTPVMRDGEPKK
jgi:hypothetical protein